MSGLKMWDQAASFSEAEQKWELGKKEAEAKAPIRKLKKLPNVVGITAKTERGLKWKSLIWIIKKDRRFKILKGFLHHPIRYGIRYLRSLFSSLPYTRDRDFFYYGIDSEMEFCRLAKKSDSVFVAGFSYCHKPFECPSGRFTDKCIHDPKNTICSQCFIGKSMHALPGKTIPLIIPTIHYVGEKIFEIVHSNRDKQVVFLITACEMTLRMFGDLGHMAGIKGIGVRLDGRICNTMEAFRLSEEGIKPGLTVVTDETQDRIFLIFKELRS